MDRPLEIDVQRRDDVAVMKISGSATMAVTDELTNRLIATAEEPIRLMVIDLADVDFICSEGLGAIVSAHLKCIRRDGTVRLSGPNEAIRELLDLTKLSKLLAIYPTIDEAISN